MKTPHAFSFVPMWIAACMGLGALLGCGNRHPEDILLRVRAFEWSQPGLPALGVDVTLEEQRLENGILNGYFTEVATESTGQEGVVELSTPLANVLSLRVRASKEGCFDEVVLLNPEDLLTDGTWNEVTLNIMAQCQVQATVRHDSHCTNQPLLYRWIPRNVPGSQGDIRWTGGTDWNALNSPESDDVSALITGGTWLLHHRVWQCAGADSTALDSVWCPEGGSIQFTLD
ncbi:MAG: hypothetical protein O3B70_06380 [Bacteroidetes bacterium]|nr:hypothetical protein [Bacteroidota bacterium]MDA0903944.1 hypothetical protein [Bacteroidota bacterium]MDA1242790.1 hypothetical protein [Bacteroidota bacterium]